MADRTFILGPNGPAIALTPEEAEEFARTTAGGAAREEGAVEGFARAREAALEAEYGDGFANTALAGLAGGARGLTLGLSDLALKGVLDDDQMFGLEQLRLRNEIASTAGEIGGALAPALFTGGSGLLGAASRLTPAGALTRAGSAAASRVAGETVAAKALQGAIQAGIEGTGMGLGNSITQAALHDDPFTVESVAANMALGGVLGVGAGGLLGAAGGLAGKALRKAKPESVAVPLDDIGKGLSTIEGRVDDMVAQDAARAAQSKAELEAYENAVVERDIYDATTEAARKDHEAARKAALKQFNTDWKAHTKELAKAHDYEQAELRAMFLARQASKQHALEQELSQAYDDVLLAERLEYEGKSALTKLSNEDLKGIKKFHEQRLKDFSRFEKDAQRGLSTTEAEIARLEGKPVRPGQLDDELSYVQSVRGHKGQNVQKAMREHGLTKEQAYPFKNDSVVFDQTQAPGMAQALERLVTKRGNKFSGVLNQEEKTALVAEARAKYQKLAESYKAQRDVFREELADLATDAYRTEQAAVGKFKAPEKPDLFGPRQQFVEESFSPPTKPDFSFPEFTPSGARPFVAAEAPSTFDTALSDALLEARKGLKAYLGESVDLSKLVSLEAKEAAAALQHLDRYTRTAQALDDSFGQSFGINLAASQEAIAQKLTNAGFGGAYAAMAPLDIARALKMPAEKVAELGPFAQTMAKIYSATRSQAPEVVAERVGIFKKLLIQLGIGAGRNAIPGGLRGAGMAASTVRGGVRQAGGLLGGKIARTALGAGVGYAAGGKEGAIGGAMFAAGASGHTASRVATGAAKAVKALTGRTAAKAVTAGSILAATAFGNDKDKDPARARMKEIAAAVTSPATNNALRTATLPLYMQNPAVGEKVQMALAARLQYLAERSPWRPPTKALRTFKAEPQPSRYEVAKWARIVRAAEQPLTLLEDLENRQLTPEAVTTVKDLYPELFSRMQVAVMEQVASLKQGLSYQSRLQVAVFFDTPIDASQTPEFGATIQGLYGQAAQTQAQPRGSLGTPAPATTQTQRLTMPQ